MDLSNLKDYDLAEIPFLPSENKSLKTYLIELGANEGDIARVFDDEGKLLLIPGFDDWWSLEPEKLADHLLILFNGHYELQQVVLNKLIPTGFNDHGPTHIERVTRQTLKILQESQADENTQRIGVIAAACHDLGNMIDRKEHHAWSCKMAMKILGLKVENPRDLHVLQCIYFHEEKAHKDHSLISRLPQCSLALILADKTDVSYLRVHNTSDQKEAIKDMHVVINFMVDQSRLQFYGTKVQWRLLFNPGAARVLGLFSHLLKHEDRKYVPQEWQVMYRNEHIEYLFIFYAKILSIYLERIRLSALSALLLFPSTKKFEFVVEDQERHVLIKREFMRDTAQIQIEELRHNLHKNE